jgi:XTP/dITP diphosphohydrolase
VLVFVDPVRRDSPLVADGACEGAIAPAARGTGGFGYDPIFGVGAAGKTMAELEASEKNLKSHRARAAQALIPGLRRWLGLDR